jgi:hypothetical protein
VEAKTRDEDVARGERLGNFDLADAQYPGPGILGGHLFFGNETGASPVFIMIYFGHRPVKEALAHVEEEPCQEGTIESPVQVGIGRAEYDPVGETGHVSTAHHNIAQCVVRPGGQPVFGGVKQEHFAHFSNLLNTGDRPIKGKFPMQQGDE